MDEPKRILRHAFAAEETSAAALGEEALGRHAGIARRMFDTPVLPLREMLAPGIAEFAKALTDGINVYRTMFFVSVLKIDMLYVAGILTLIGIWDVLNDPISGIAYDRSRTRWGKNAKRCTLPSTKGAPWWPPRSSRGRSWTWKRRLPLKMKPIKLQIRRNKRHEKNPRDPRHPGRAGRLPGRVRRVEARKAAGGQVEGLHGLV